MATTAMPRTRLLGRLLAVGALTLLAGSLLAGLLPVSYAGVNCGNVLVESDDPMVADLADTFGAPRTGIFGGVSTGCDDRRAARRLPAVLLLVGAGGAGIAWLVVAGSRERVDQDHPRDRRRRATG